MNDPIDRLEQTYSEKLAERCTVWQTKHPDEAKAIREEVAAKFRRVGQADPELGSFAWQMIEAAVNEAIRVKNKWPTIRAWLAEQPPPRQFTDHKQAASGDR